MFENLFKAYINFVGRLLYFCQKKGFKRKIYKANYVKVTQIKLLNKKRGVIE